MDYFPLFLFSRNSVFFVVTLLLVYSIKKAFIEPLLMTALMQVYFCAIAGQTPNPEWTKKLENLSDKFCKMKDKFVGPEPEPGQAMIGAQEASADAALPHEQWPAPQVPQQQSPEQQAYQVQPVGRPYPWIRSAEHRIVRRHFTRA